MATYQKATLDDVHAIGVRDGWDQAVDAFTAILDDDILTDAPGAELVGRVRMRKNLQSLRKRNPGRPAGVADVAGLASAPAAPPEPERPRPPMPVPYIGPGPGKGPPAGGIAVPIPAAATET